MKLPKRIAPGWAAALFDAKGIKREITEGVADLEENAAVTAQTRFRWFSITKLATATAALKLAEEGKLDLDAPVSEHLEWFAPMPEAPVVTARQLLCHSSGLHNPLAAGWVHPMGDMLRSQKELTRSTFERHRKLKSKPGERARYSNLGYLVLGELVSAIAKENFDQYIARTVLTPLGLERTTFDSSQAAAGHERWLTLRAAGMMAVIPRSWRMIRYLREGWAGLHPFAIEGQAYGGLVGSLEDLVRFGRVLLGEGKLGRRRILKAESVLAMRERHSVGPDSQHGLGFWIEHPWVFHAGEAGGFRSLLQLDFTRGIGIVVLANCGTAPVEAVAAMVAAEQA